MTGSALVRDAIAAADAEPDSIALSDATSTWSRSHIFAHAGGLAAALAADGLAAGHDPARVTADRTVAVLAGDVRDLAVSAVGIVAAGGIVLPLDPRLDDATRAARLVAAGATRLVVGDAVRAEATDAPLVRTMLRLDRTGTAPLIPGPASADAVALLSSSSGSTGRATSHDLTLRELDRMRALTELAWLRPGERLGMLLGATGAMVSRLLTGLALGASAHVLDARRLRPEQALDSFSDAAIAMLDVVPTYLRWLLAAAPGPSALPSLRILTCVGEPLLWADIARVRAVLNAGCTVANRYGSVDTGRISVGWIGPEDPIGPDPTGSVPVGRALPGIGLHVIDADGRPVPSGSAGEVVVDTHSQRRTEGRVDLPDGRSRYRTGDLGRILPDGQLELLGRIDRLVKIGGIRVQPARIEGLLRSLPWIDDALVLPEPGPDGVPILIAHVVGIPGPDDLGPDLSLRLRSALHPAEIPERLVIRPDPFPTLPTGKIDGLRLRAGYRSETTMTIRVGRPD